MLQLVSYQKLKEIDEWPTSEFKQCIAAQAPSLRSRRAPSTFRAALTSACQTRSSKNRRTEGDMDALQVWAVPVTAAARAAVSARERD